MKSHRPPQKTSRMAVLVAWAKWLYLRIGFHTAEETSLLFGFHRLVVALYRPLSVLTSRSRQPTFFVPSGNYAELLVAFRVSGGIGDHLMAARYLRDLLAVAGPFRFDVYSARPQAANWIFRTFPEFHNCYAEGDRSAFHRYPLAMWLISFVKIYSNIVDWRYISENNPRLASICQHVEQFKPDVGYFIRDHPRLAGSIAAVTLMLGMKRTTFLHGMSGIEYGGDLLSIDTDPNALQMFGLEGISYITVHNGFDEVERARIPSGGSLTKCYPRYAELVATLRARLPRMFVVQLGVASTSAAIEGVDLNLISRTSLAQTAEILRHAALHIDNEGGLVHLAACLGVTSCVIFGPTSVDYFGYPTNVNIRPTFCGNCFWMTRDWMVTCPRNFGEPRCLSLQDPTAIAEKIYKSLAPIFTGESGSRL
jgi:hypothetical protein